MADLNIKYFEQKVSSNKSIIFGHVLSGVFKGLHFEMELVDSMALDKGRRSTRVLLKAIHTYDKLPVPELFIRFGFEIVL